MMSTNVVMFLGVILVAGITGAAVSYGVNEIFDDTSSQLAAELEYTPPSIAYNCSYILPETLQINVYDTIMDWDDLYLVHASEGLANTYVSDDKSYTVWLKTISSDTRTDLTAHLTIFWQMNAPINGTLHYRIGPDMWSSSGPWVSWLESTFAVTERFIDANYRISLVIHMWSIEEATGRDYHMQFKIWDPTLEKFTTIESRSKQPSDTGGSVLSMRIDEMRFDPTSRVS
ncbi:MAG: hypothetical protein ACFFB3_22375 [Candidatus Hodarchaeota archaeon]